MGITDFKGVIPAMLTVFDEQEQVDEKATREFTRFLLSFDIGGLYVTGSTGETFLMNGDERKKVVEIVMDEVAGKVPVVVHVGDIGTKLSVELARHAEHCGAAGISSVPPFYFQFTDDQIFRYYEDIAGSTSLPMIVYNIANAGMMTADMVSRLAGIPNVRGVKYTGTALYEVTDMRDSCGEDFQIYGGCDQLGSSNIALGVDGIIGSYYNVIPDLYLRIWKAVKESNVREAASLQRKALRVIELGTTSGSMMACIKLWLRTAGVSAGYARRPFTNFTEEERKSLADRLLELDEKEQIGLEVARRIRERN